MATAPFISGQASIIAFLARLRPPVRFRAASADLVVDLSELIIEQLQRIVLMRSEMARSHHQKTRMHLL
ncbi:hypothetical protein CO675_14265 [Bradyrhizobium sp. C9]|nr:hypothetical protein CO675_14265 [Bradyrhizobium sp. C9]